MDIPITFAEKVLEFTLVPVVRQFGYVIFYNRNIDELKKEAENLKAAREDVENKVRAAENNNEEIGKTVELWKGRVGVITAQADRFFEKESDANTGCSCKSCPNLWLRYKLSRQAKKMAAEVGELNGKLPQTLVVLSTGRKLLQAVGDSSVVGEAFKSRVSTMNEIMEALADPAIHMIGLYGLGGVGKTTIAKQVAKKAQDEKLFDEVLFVEVKRYEIEEIQSQIAYLVGLEFGKECKNETVRANELRQRLEKEKSFLIVLDDLWERLDFKRVGIPSADEGNAHHKFILTSRREDLLSARMNCKKNIVVGLLSAEEAWGLFKKTAEIIDNDNSDLVSIANEVSQKCAQLPVAIVAVAGALRNNNNLADWRDASRRLKGHLSRNVSAIKKVDSSIKLSYEYLGSKELKSIFLYSAMFCQDPLIMDLFMYVVGLELLGGIHNLKEARDALDSSLRKLKASSLLLDSYSKDRFTIHDVVRDVALSIAFEENHALVKRHEKVDDWPNEYQPESCTAICLDECDIDELPKELYGPKVKFFYLYSKDTELNASSNFFDGMQELKVLSLNNMTFSSLPSSIRLLKKLTTLSLHSCTLEDITLVQHLKKLKILNLSRSRIKQLPCEVGQLGCLKILNLSYCHELKVIPPNILSNLKKLEELYMRGSFDRWEAEGLNEGKERASLDELKHLQELSALEIHIPDTSVLPKDLFSENSLERYKISIERYDSLYGCDFSRVLALTANNNINMEYGIFKLFERVENLTLNDLNGIESLYQSHITTQTCCNLRAIKVYSCDKLKYLFSVSVTRIPANLETIGVFACKSLEEIVAFVDEENIEKGSTTDVIELRQLRSLTLDDLPVLTNFCFSNQVTFPNLETLILASINCPNIWDIFTSKSSGTQSHVTAQTFCKLATIEVRSCDQLKSLFLVWMAGILSRLESIEVSECKSLEEIVAFDDNENVEKGSAMNVIEFLQLRFLKLNDLPALTDICFSDKVAFPKLETLTLVSVNCHNLWHIPTSTGSRTQIVEIVESSQMRTVFNDSLPNRSFSNLKTLKVEKCHFLLKLIPLHIVKSLSNLEELEIRNCASLEVVFDFGEFNNYKETHTFRLKTLLLSYLPKLEAVWSRGFQGIINFQSLQKFKIINCDKLEVFQAADGKVAFPKLETLTLASVNCHNIWHIPTSTGNRTQMVEIVESSQMRTVFNDSLPERCFSNLKTLKVEKCRFLLKLIPSHILKSLSNLEKLKIKHCDSLEVVFDFGELNNDKEAHTFRLKTLVLRDLPILEAVWSRGLQGIVSFQSLKKLEIRNCNKLEIFQAVDEKVFPKLEELLLGGREAKMMWNGEFRMYRFSTVKALSLSEIDDKAATFSYGLFYGFPRLEQLYLSWSTFLVIFSCPKRPLDNDVQKVTSIERLNLSFMKKLKHIWDGKCQLDHVLQNVKSLSVSYCGELINLGPSCVSLENLTELEVHDCNGLINLLTSSTARTLVQLTSLKIESCKKMEEIVTKGDDVEREIVFAKLKKLELNQLLSCRSFCCHNHNLNFPLLDEVTIKGCPRFRIFCPGFITTPLLKGMEVGNDGMHWQGSLNSTIQQLFNEGSLFAVVDKLDVKNDEYPELIDVWNGKLASGWSFTNLTSLVMDNCSFLSNHVIPFYVLTSFINLRELEVRNCESVEVVFDLEGLDIDKEAHTLQALPLWSLKIKHLPNLKYVWNKDPHTIHCFQHLWEMSAYECENLRSIFPASIARGLINLWSLNIESCGVEVIVAESQTPTSTIHFVFPELLFLHLIKLPNLKNFYPQRHTAEFLIVSFPSLQKLKITNCNKLEIFQAVDEKVFPKLEELMLGGREAKMLWNGEFRMYRFSTVKVLSLSDTYDKAATFPYGLFYGFPKLEQLNLRTSSFSVIFSCPKRPLDSDAQKATSIKRLKLFYMKKLKHIWDGKCQLDHVLQNVKALDVFYCDELINLGPSYVSLENLTELDVHDCNGLINLLTSSTARTLVQLTSLKITRCKNMEEILTNGDDVESEIVFAKLKKLELNQLLSCRSFCCHNHNLNFPLLDEVTIKGCPRFRIFCPGFITTPLLKGMEVGNDGMHWQGSLNSTIQQLFNEGSLFADLRNLDVKNDEYPELIDVWNGKLASGWSFTNLTSLVMDNCSFLSNHVIPSYVLTSFINLERLEVRNCESVEVVFDLGGLDIDKEAHKLQALPLRFLTIKHLPNLKYVWNKDPHTIHCFQGLSSMSAYECENLRSIFPASIARGLTILLQLEIKSCGIEVIVAESQTPTSTIHFVFPELCSLDLIKLPNLKNFYPQRHTVECPKLQRMNVRQCKKVKVFSWEETEITEKEAEDGVGNEQYPLFLFEKVVPQLRSLVLNQNHVKIIRNDQIQEDIFNKVDSLTLDSFYEDEPLDFPYTFIDRFPELQILEVSHSSFKSIFPCEGHLVPSSASFDNLQCGATYFQLQEN